MIAEIGHFSLILALLLASLQAVIPLAGSFTGNTKWMNVGHSTTAGVFVFYTIAIICLTASFLASDFTVGFVANNSNRLLPTMYKITAVWGGHEGAMLLWTYMFTCWALAVSFFSKSIPREMVARVLSTMGFITIGFTLFMLVTSDPFARIFPPPFDGRDLNPLLQHPGMIIHPPLLYMGYAGFSVAFSFAIAALIGGQLDSVWARWSRPWTVVAWVFLTLGIMLGSWWAYMELGWGGWWFWDPVENASFMPWLVGTALIHSLAVSEKRGALKNWTVLLAIFTFSLSLLGTFLVRSGVLTSVHAFAKDPARGLFILIFLVIIIGASLLLYAWRAPKIKSGGKFRLLSRESLLLGNNLLFTLLTAIVLYGTLAPLIYDAFNLGKISVGFPWFSFMFTVFAPFLFFIMAIGTLVRWKKHEAGKLVKTLGVPFIISLVIAVILSIPGILPTASWRIGLGTGLSVWILLALFLTIKERLKNKKGIMQGLRAQSRSFYAMILAHAGMAMVLLGITFVSVNSIETDVRMAPGEVKQVGEYTFLFNGATSATGPNYQAARGDFTVTKNGKFVTTLYPEKRSYSGEQSMPMTEADIDVGFWRDVFASLGEPLDNGAWSMRLSYRPLISWIWLGSILMSIGGILAVLDRRYRLKPKPRKARKQSGQKPEPKTNKSAALT